MKSSSKSTKDKNPKYVDQLLHEIEDSKLTYKGNRLLKQYLENESLSVRESITAKCASCMNYYMDGRQSCELPECPLYPYSPYH